MGLVLPELQNPIFPAFAEVIGGALAQQGLTPVLCTQTKGGVSEADYVELLLQQQVSGVVFAGGGLFAQADAPHDHYRAARRAQHPRGAHQRLHRGPRLSLHRLRRRGGRGADPGVTWSRSVTSASAWCSALRPHPPAGNWPPPRTPPTP